jgi:hypothetical protein
MRFDSYNSVWCGVTSGGARRCAAVCRIYSSECELTLAGGPEDSKVASTMDNKLPSVHSWLEFVVTSKPISYI